MSNARGARLWVASDNIDRNGAAGRRSDALLDVIFDLEPIQEAADLGDLFAALARSIVRAVQADACLITELHDGEILREVAASVRPPARIGLVAERHQMSRFPTLRDVFQTGRSAEISIGDPQTPELERSYLFRAGFARMLACRFRVDGRSIGVVEIFRIADRPFRRDDPRQIGLLMTFAANAYARIQLAAKLESHYTETIAALAAALDAKDPYTHEHTSRMNDMAGALSVAMQVPVEGRPAVRLGAILHDVGKIGISDSILLKNGPLSPEEWAVMKTHPEIGERMLRRIEFIRPALPTIRHHHERWDGTGYPDGLAGEDIPLGARIVSVCDAFDAMISERPYSPAMSVEHATRELLDGAGTQFDPVCARLLVEIVEQIGEAHLEDRFIRYAS